MRRSDEVSYEISVSETAKAHSETKRAVVDELLNDRLLTQNWTSDEIVESIAIKKTHEERWDSLEINEICIPDAEVSLWS